MYTLEQRLPQHIECQRISSMVKKSQDLTKCVNKLCFIQNTLFKIQIITLSTNISIQPFQEMFIFSQRIENKNVSSRASYTHLDLVCCFQVREISGMWTGMRDDENCREVTCRCPIGQLGRLSPRHLKICSGLGTWKGSSSSADLPFNCKLGPNDQERGLEY